MDLSVRVLRGMPKTRQGLNRMATIAVCIGWADVTSTLLGGLRFQAKERSLAQLTITRQKVLTHLTILPAKPR